MHARLSGKETSAAEKRNQGVLLPCVCGQFWPNLEKDHDLQKMTRETEAIIFPIVQIAQESLTDVHRHAKTKTAKVQISQSPQTVRIEVEENGDGIPGFTTLEGTELMPGVESKGMRERVRQLNDSFEIESGPAGTIVAAVLPTNCFS